MLNVDAYLSSFVILWAVIDPFGTVPVYLAVTKKYDLAVRKHIAFFSSVVSFFVLLFFMVAGEVLLKRLGVPLAAFQISGGIILFLFALNMIFGDSKPEEELHLIRPGSETAIFPLAVPSIAGPGAILATVLLSNNFHGSLLDQGILILIIVVILFVNFIFMRLSSQLQAKIGNSGAIVISKVMGLILASMAANNVLIGIQTFFNLG